MRRSVLDPYERPLTEHEERLRRIVSAAKRLDLESQEPDPGGFYVLDSKRVSPMPVAKLARISGVSETMLHYYLIGRSTFSSMMRQHIATFIRMDPGTIKELGVAAKRERRRRFGEIDEPCSIPPPLFHYFKPFNRIGPSPDSEKYKQMVEERKGKARYLPRGTYWFEKKAREIAEQIGFEPDENGIYRKPGKG